MLHGRARRLSTSTLIAVTAAALLGLAPTAMAQWGQPAAERVRAAAVDYPAQVPAWRGCISRAADPGLPSAYYRLQCATLIAPLDWNAPDDGRQVQIAVSRLPATELPAKGVLFTNPGGPGGAGIDLPLLFVSDARKALLRSQDIYGMDVRGTGDSANVTCGGSPSMLLDPRDRTPANLDLIMDGAQLTARACALAGGDLIQHVTTDQTVRDLELLRAVIAAPTVNWLGYSAGTWLGAEYATAYPARVGHMVLDSNVDFTGTWQAAFEAQPAAFERRFQQDFLPWVAKYHKVYGLGSTAAAVDASYERIRAGLRSDVPIDSAVTLDQVLAGALYSKYLFAEAASVLVDLDDFLAAKQAADQRRMRLARARTQAALPRLRRADLARQPLASDASDAAFLAVTCNDTPWTSGRSELVNRSGQLGAVAPLLGWSTVAEPCAFWNRPAVLTPVPTGAGVPPVLMVQSEHDPATPIEGARRSQAAFAGARMLTVTGEGDHGLYAGGNSCVNKAVESFIVSGTLPAEGATCAGRPLPDPTSSNFAAAEAGARLPSPGSNPLVALRELSELISGPISDGQSR